MDPKFYYQSIDKMEKAGVDREYIQGWIGGYMGNPPREEQRVTPAYEAGYGHGEAGEADEFSSWLAGAAES